MPRATVVAKTAQACHAGRSRVRQPCLRKTDSEKMIFVPEHESRDRARQAMPKQHAKPRRPGAFA